MLESASHFHPELQRTLLISDVSVSMLKCFADEGLGQLADLLCCDNLGFDALGAMRTYYDALELSSALKILGSAYILRSEQECLFLDPDMVLLHPLDALLSVRGSVVCTVHTRAPFPRDGLTPDDLEICACGVVNGGVLLTRRGPDTARALDWLAMHTKYHWFVAPQLGMYGDQLWLSCLPYFFGETTVVNRHPAINVAYWNLHERPLQVRDDRVYLADGPPLALFHFSGYSSLGGGRLTKHSLRKFDASTEDALRVIIQEYEARLVDSRRRWGHLRGDLPFATGTLPSRLARAGSLWKAPELVRLHDSPYTTHFKQRIARVLRRLIMAD
jgi:hypothetical protein